MTCTFQAPQKQGTSKPTAQWRQYTMALKHLHGVSFCLVKLNSDTALSKHIAKRQFHSQHTFLFNISYNYGRCQLGESCFHMWATPHLWQWLDKGIYCRQFPYTHSNINVSCSIGSTCVLEVYVSIWSLEFNIKREQLR